MLEVDIHEARTRLDSLIESALAGNDVILMRGDRPVLKLTRIGDSPKRRQSGSARGQIKMADDFDAPLEDFREYMS